MKIQIFSQYYNLAQAGVVKPLACPNHKEDELSGATFLLNHKEENDRIILYCLACGYEQSAGIQLYENILKEIANAGA